MHTLPPITSTAICHHTFKNTENILCEKTIALTSTPQGGIKKVTYKPATPEANQIGKYKKINVSGETLYQLRK